MEWENLLSSKRIRNFSLLKEEDVIAVRNQFDMDYERIIYSSSVRRLQDKAQVFPLQRNDFTRTRLTHSIEVASLGRSMAWTIAKNMSEMDSILKSFDTLEKIRRLPSLVETACLVHDLGNPPFGHYGEDVIRCWFRNFFKNDIESDYSKLTRNLEKSLSEKLTIIDEKLTQVVDSNERKKLLDQRTLIKKNISRSKKSLREEEKNDFLWFDGNAQTIRILTKLQFLNDEFGVNFTLATLATLIKYPRNSTKAKEINKPKFGYLCSEKKEFEMIVSETGISPHRHPATYILEAADDIAYLTDDIEDGVKKGLISWKEIQKFGLLKLVEKINTRKYASLRKKLNQCTKNKSPNMDLVKYQNLKIVIQGILIENAVSAFQKNYNEIINGKFKGDLICSEDSQSLKDLLAKIAVEKCFSSEEVIKLELVGDKVIWDLLNLFVEAILLVVNDNEYSSKEDKLVSLISDNFIHVQKLTVGSRKFSDLSNYQRIQIVIDFITGMTDSYAVDLHKVLMNGKLNGI